MAWVLIRWLVVCEWSKGDTDQISDLQITTEVGPDDVPQTEEEQSNTEEEAQLEEEQSETEEEAQTIAKDRPRRKASRQVVGRIRFPNRDVF